MAFLPLAVSVSPQLLLITFVLSSTQPGSHPPSKFKALWRDNARQIEARDVDRHFQKFSLKIIPKDPAQLVC